MEIVKRKQAQLSSDQDYHSVTLRSSRAACRQVHLYSPPAFPHAKCRAERLNPSRFSDPLHRATLLRRSLTLVLPQRTPKAYSWYLDNRFPWKRENSRPLFEDTTFSLFGSHGGGQPRRVPSIFLVPSQDDLPSGETGTEGAPMRDGWAGRNSETSSCRSGLWGARSDFSHRAPSPDLLSPYSGSLRSRRSLSPAYSHRLSPVFGEKRVSYRSDMSAGALSPRSSHILQLSPAGLSQLSPAGLSQLSPAGLSQLPPAGLSQLSPSGLSPRSSRVLQWIRRNYPPSTSSSTSSHSPARCTLSITSKDADTSVGSETDDDFVFVSCRQLVDDLANLSLPSGPDSPPDPRLPEVAGRHVGGAPERPALQVQHGEAPDAEDDLSFELCSDDDVLSDDVFEDENARSATCPRGGGEEGELRAEGQTASGAGRDASAEEEDLDCPEGCSALAVEALRRNSLQGKWRRLWRNRRVRAAGKRQKTGTATSPTSARSQKVAESPSPAAVATASSSAASPSPANVSRELGPAPDVVTDSAASPSAEEREEKRGYHYVISPTDDVTMPEVIAVRKSSVELLKWQNSLRRRRRRQAKRHDLCRTKSRAPTSAAESKEAV